MDAHAKSEISALQEKCSDQATVMVRYASQLEEVFERLNSLELQLHHDPYDTTPVEAVPTPKTAIIGLPPGRFATNAQTRGRRPSRASSSSSIRSFTLKFGLTPLTQAGDHLAP